MGKEIAYVLINITIFPLLRIAETKVRRRLALKSTCKASKSPPECHERTEEEEMTTIDATQVRYSTLYRLGHWCSLEAECRTRPCPEWDVLIKHEVRFVLIDKYGDRCQFGYSIITGQTDCYDVFDEDGEEFPDLETAVRTHAAELMKVTELPGRWRDRPARYDTFQDTVATAFDLVAKASGR
jgi:hypothetical protein